MGFFKDFEEFSSAAVETVREQKREEKEAPAQSIPEPENVQRAPEPEVIQEPKTQENVFTEEKIEEPFIPDRTIIAKDTVFIGNIETKTPVDVYGEVHGDIHCRDTLNIRGIVKGDCYAKEAILDTAHIQGNVVCETSVSLGIGSVVVGNIEAKTAAVDGAVKGDLDIKGPVAVSSSAVVIGNIKSKSVEINSGASIEGFCQKAYQEVDAEEVYDDDIFKDIPDPPEEYVEEAS